MRPATAFPPDLSRLDSIELISLCADYPEGSELWTEFLRRFAAKIKYFIRGTLRQSMASEARGAGFVMDSHTTQEADLFQNTILKLVENRCAVLRRFSGKAEDELMAYLAVVSRSVVRDHFRKVRAQKRGPWPASIVASKDSEQTGQLGFARRDWQNSMEREILARELEQVSMETIKSHSGDPDRDRLIFQLYFKDGLSTAQIAACEGVGLSKTGIEKTLNRLKDRVRTAVGAEPVAEAREV
jgi:RNA polymerase sigma factor (sigma-70 family)